MLNPEAQCLIFLVLSLLLFLYNPGFGHPLVSFKAGTGSLQSSLYRSKDMAELLMCPGLPRKSGGSAEKQNEDEGLTNASCVVYP